MWLRVAIIAGQFLVRVLIRLAPFVLVGLAALLRKYRWPLYYRSLAMRPARVNLSAVPAILLSSAGALLLLGVGLYLVVSFLAPHP
jgi:hypothetical protein